MRNLYKYGLMVFFIFIINKNIYSNESIPDWINNIDKYCSKEEYCAVGYGDDERQANLNASFKIAKYFSKYTDTMENTEIPFKDRDTNDTIKEATNIILEKIKIIKQFTLNQKIYSFVTLNKSEIAEHIKNEINNLDIKIKVFLSLNKVDLKEFQTFYKLRNNLNRKYIYVANSSISTPYKDTEIEAKIQSNQQKFYINSTDNRVKNVVEKIIKENYHIVINDHINYDRRLDVRMQISKNKFANGKMLDYSVVLIITVRDRNGKLINTIHNNFMTKSTNDDDCITQIVNQIYLYLRENYYLFI